LPKVWVFHGGAQAMAHIPRCFVRSAPDLALNLESAHALLGIEHLPEHFKPDLQRKFGVLTDRPANDAETIVFARFAEPMKRPRVQLVDRGIAAFRTADNAVPPTVFHQELLAGFVRREGFHQFSELLPIDRPAAGVEMAQNHAAQVPASALSAARSIAEPDDRVSLWLRRAMLVPKYGTSRIRTGYSLANNAEKPDESW
jgi:hypothetical protein